MTKVVIPNVKKVSARLAVPYYTQVKVLIRSMSCLLMLKPPMQAIHPEKKTMSLNQ